MQITFRQKWNDERLAYDHRLSLGDMRSKFSSSETSNVQPFELLGLSQALSIETKFRQKL